MKTLTELIKEKCKFIYFVDKELWYETESGFQFPIPLEDVGTTLFVAEYRGIRLMKWIRKHLGMIETEKSKAQEVFEKENITLTPKKWDKNIFENI